MPCEISNLAYMQLLLYMIDLNYLRSHAVTELEILTLLEKKVAGLTA